ncbi:MAG: Wzz/FepE/Etk N-terminal domain-containing protein [Clostridiales bacterium]|nr:Wzz/FepE/Etk N-terminal domain-containing protein [Clostridiales bacterium]
MNEEQNRGENSDVVEIDLLPLLKALWKGAWLIVTAMLLACSIFYLGTKAFITPTYQASFTAYVNNRTASTESTSTLTSSDLTAAKSLVYTYVQILTGRTVLESAAAEAGVDYSYTEMSEYISANVVDDTEIIEVTVTVDSPETALALAEAMADIVPDYIAEIVEGSSMQIIDAPVLPTSIYSPNYLRNAVIGAFLGAVLAAAVIVLRELLDDTVKDEQEIEKRFGISVVGVIPDLASVDKQGYGYGYGQKRKGGAE